MQSEEMTATLAAAARAVEIAMEEHGWGRLAPDPDDFRRRKAAEVVQKHAETIQDAASAAAAAETTDAGPGLIAALRRAFGGDAADVMHAAAEVNRGMVRIREALRETGVLGVEQLDTDELVQAVCSWLSAAQADRELVFQITDQALRIDAELTELRAQKTPAAAGKERGQRRGAPKDSGPAKAYVTADAFEQIMRHRYGAALTELADPSTTRLTQAGAALANEWGIPHDLLRDALVRTTNKTQHDAIADLRRIFDAYGKLGDDPDPDRYAGHVPERRAAFEACRDAMVAGEVCIPDAQQSPPEQRVSTCDGTDEQRVSTCDGTPERHVSPGLETSEDEEPEPDEEVEPDEEPEPDEEVEAARFTVLVRHGNMVIVEVDNAAGTLIEYTTFTGHARWSKHSRAIRRARDWGEVRAYVETLNPRGDATRRVHIVENRDVANTWRHWLWAASACACPCDPKAVEAVDTFLRAIDAADQGHAVALTLRHGRAAFVVAPRYGQTPDAITQTRRVELGLALRAIRIAANRPIADVAFAVRLRREGNRLAGLAHDDLTSPWVHHVHLAEQGQLEEVEIYRLIGETIELFNLGIQ